MFCNYCRFYIPNKKKSGKCNFFGVICKIKGLNVLNLSCKKFCTGKVSKNE